MKRGRWRWLAALPLAWFAAVAAYIAHGPPVSRGNSDVVIVLGAAVRGDRPSPVFAARIEHGITLWRAGRVRYLLFTGGKGEGASHAESAVARREALRAGVPASAILTEAASHTTRQNIIEAKSMMRTAKLRRALIVSDPLHLRRALAMARGEGIEAAAAPAPATRYRSLSTQLPFLLRETWFLHVYWLLGM